MIDKYTPGPWRVCHKSETLVEDGVVVESPNDHEVRPMLGVKLGDEMADLRLIAAAPKLLEALRRIMDADCPLSGTPSHSELVEFWEYEKSQGRGEAEDRLFALAAIAEATGGAE